MSDFKDHTPEEAIDREQRRKRERLLHLALVLDRYYVSKARKRSPTCHEPVPLVIIQYEAEWEVLLAEIYHDEP